MVFVKNLRFASFLFFEKQARKMCLTIFSIEKQPFQIKKNINFKNPKKIFFLDSKNTFFKNRKHCIFPKGLVHGSGQNLKFFLISFRQKIGKKNVFDDILEKKKPVQIIKTSTLKSRRNSIFPKGGKKNLFDDNLDTKNPAVWIRKTSILKS